MKPTPDEVIKNMEKSVTETFNFFRGMGAGKGGAAVLARLVNDWRLLQAHVLDAVPLKEKGGAADTVSVDALTMTPVDVLIREVRELKWVTALTGSENMTAARGVVSSAVELADMQEEGE